MRVSLSLCNLSKSGPTGSSALSFSPKAINLKFKGVTKCLSVRLLNCSYSGHFFNSRSGLVDSGNEVKLFKKNLYSPPKCSHFYRLQRFHMGCNSKSSQNSKPMARKSARLAHEYKGANGSISCSTAAIRSQLPKQSHTAVFRQYNSCRLLKSPSGHFHSKVIGMFVVFLGYKIMILVFFRVFWNILGTIFPKTALKSAIWVFFRGLKLNLGIFRVFQKNF